MASHLIIVILIAFVFFLDLATPLGIADGILYVVTVMLTVRTRDHRILFGVAGVCMVLVLAAVPFHEQAIVPWIAMANRSLSEMVIFVIALLSGERLRAERELRYGEERYHSLVSATSSVVLTAEYNGSPAPNQPAWTAFTGQPWEQQKNWGWVEMVHPDDRRRVRERYEEAVAKKGEFEVEARLWHAASGRHHHTRAHAVPVRNGQGAVREWVGMVVDIDVQRNMEIALDEYRATLEERVAERTDDLIRANRKLEEEVQTRIAAETDLRNSGEKYRALMDRAGDAIILATPEGFIFEVNKRAEFMLGYSKKEMRHFHFSKIFTRESLPRAAQCFQQLRETGLTSLRDAHVLRKDGAAVPVDISGSLIELSGQKIAQGIFRDISERKQAEEALRKLKNAIEQAAEGVVIANSEGVIEYVNPAIEKNSGYSWAELIGRTPRVFKSGRHGPDYYRRLWTDIKGGTIWRGEMVNKKKSGELYEEEMTISPVTGDNGDITHFVAIKRTVTEEKLLRQQLHHAEKLSAIGTFVSGVAHELNNPLTSIIGFSRLLMKEEGIPPEVGEKLEILNSQAGRAASIVKNLLKFSKPHKPEKAPHLLNNLVEEMVALNSYGFAGEKIHLVRRYCEGTHCISVDGGQVQQVFVNIIMNAVSAMKDVGGGTLTVTTELAGNTAKAVFENTGKPIPDQMLERIFEPFMSTKGKGGTGLGLYISRSIIVENGGRIWAENMGDEGVRFVVAFPATACVQTENPPPAPVPEENLRGLRVLFAEDEEPIRKWIGSILLAEGIFVQFARDGHEAVRLLEESDYDVILSNCRMPEMDGIELGEWIAKNKPGELRKLVFATGDIDSRAGAFCSLHGCKVILKPYEKEEILRVIADVARPTV